VVTHHGVASGWGASEKSVLRNKEKICILAGYRERGTKQSRLLHTTPPTNKTPHPNPKTERRPKQGNLDLIRKKSQRAVCRKRQSGLKTGLLRPILKERVSGRCGGAPSKT